MNSRQNLKRNQKREHEAISITPMDREIFWWLSRYKYLRTSMIEGLTGRSRRSLNKSLERLRNHGLIQVSQQTKDGFLLNRSYVYMLSEKGESELFDLPPRAVNINYNDPNAVRSVYKHSLYICDFVASMEIAVRNAGLEFITQDEILQRANQSNFFMKTNYNGKEVEVRPDALFGVRYKNGKVNFFMVEVENQNPKDPRNTNRSSFAHKVKTYKQVGAERGYEHLGIAGFRVLTVFTHKGAVENSLEIIKKYSHDNQSKMFLVQTQPVETNIYKDQQPFPELFTGEWHRGGLPPAFIDRYE